MALSHALPQSPKSRRRIGSRRVALVPPLVLALASSGCDDEPDCSIATTLSGAFEGELDVNAEGRDRCGFANTDNIPPGTAALAFIGNSRSMLVIVESPVIAAGGQLGRLMLIADDNVWEPEAATCTIDITEFTLEEWSKIDFFQIRGTATCPDPLVSRLPDTSDVTVAPVEFDGHIHAEVLNFDFS